MIQNSADKLSTQKALMTQPIWSGFDTWAAAVNQPENVLLHAGPAFDTVAQITIPIMNSACVAAVYEGLATNFEQAEVMIKTNEILLQPAQDFDVVTPLAAVVSASMPLHVVSHQGKGSQRRWHS